LVVFYDFYYFPLSTLIPRTSVLQFKWKPLELDQIWKMPRASNSDNKQCLNERRGGDGRIIFDDPSAETSESFLESFSVVSADIGCLNIQFKHMVSWQRQ
jgi:hypothetical protein